MGARCNTDYYTEECEATKQESGDPPKTISPRKRSEVRGANPCHATKELHTSALQQPRILVIVERLRGNSHEHGDETVSSVPLWRMVSNLARAHACEHYADTRNTLALKKAFRINKYYLILQAVYVLTDVQGDGATGDGTSTQLVAHIDRKLCRSLHHVPPVARQWTTNDSYPTARPLPSLLCVTGIKQTSSSVAV